MPPCGSRKVRWELMQGFMGHQTATEQMAEEMANGNPSWKTRHLDLILQRAGLVPVCGHAPEGIMQWQKREDMLRVPLSRFKC